MNIRIGFRRAVYVLLNLGPTGTPLFSLLLTTNERNIRPVFSHREMSEDAHQYLIHPLSLHGARL